MKSEVTMKSVTATDLNRRSFAALESSLRDGPVRITRHNKTVAVALSEADFSALPGCKARPTNNLTAVKWLLARPSRGTLSKTQVDRRLRALRA